MSTLNIPGFTAEGSLYRSRNTYQPLHAMDEMPLNVASIVPALSDADRRRCSNCENKCNAAAADCVGTASALWVLGLIGCAVFGPFAPVCAAGATSGFAVANALCAAKLAACQGLECHAPGGACCPVFCGLGHCCSSGDRCTENGCCPSNRAICGGSCCDEGERCCGGKCCPPHMFCIDNVCTYPSFGNFTPSPVTETPPVSSTGVCPPDHFACHGRCCPNGMSCCSYGCEWGHCIN